MATYPDWVPERVRRIAERHHTRTPQIEIPAHEELDDYVDALDPHAQHDGAFHQTRLPERDPDE